MILNHNKITCIKLVHLLYLYIWCTVTLISKSYPMLLLDSILGSVVAYLLLWDVAHSALPPHPRCSHWQDVLGRCQPTPAPRAPPLWGKLVFPHPLLPEGPSVPQKPASLSSVCPTPLDNLCHNKSHLLWHGYWRESHRNNSVTQPISITLPILSYYSLAFTNCSAWPVLI